MSATGQVLARLGKLGSSVFNKGKAFGGKQKLVSIGSKTIKSAKNSITNVRRIQGTSMSSIRNAVGRGTYSGMQKASNVASRMGFRGTSAKLSQNASKASGFMRNNTGKIGSGVAIGAIGYGLTKKKKKRIGSI